MFRKIALQLWLILAAIPFAYPQSGTLVPLFGDYGIKQVDFGNIGWSDDFGEIVVIDADGKILIAGGSSGRNDEPFISRLNPDGSLDSTFGMDGKKILQFEDTQDRIYRLALTDNREIILIGRSNWDLSVWQLKDDGNLDSTFGNNGSVIIPAQSEYYDEGGLGYAVDPDNKIYVSGGSKNGIKNQEDFTIVRLNPDGNFDNTFGESGKLLVHIDTADCSPIAACIPKVRAMTLDHNIKVLVAGTFDGDAVIIRIDNLGNADSTFGASGRIILSDINVKSIAIDTNDKILILGDGESGEPGNWKINVIRLNDDGSFDNTFNSNGRKLITIGDHDFDFAYDLVLDNVNNIIIAGTSYAENWDQDFSVVRLKSNGDLDSTFSDDGKLLMNVGIGGDAARSLTLDPNGKLLVAGSSYNGKNYDFSLVRVNADGTPDNTFDEDGKLLIHSNGIDVAKSMVIDSNGKVLAAGSSYTGSDNDFSMVRLNADGSPDKTFNHAGKQTIPVGNGDDFGNCTALDASGKILIAGMSDHDGQRRFSIVRLFDNGNLDTLFAADGKALLALGNDDYEGAIDMTVNSFGKILLAGGSDGYFSILCLNSDGSPDSTFNGDGKKIIDDGLNGYASCVTIDANGKIILAGHSVACSGPECGWENFQAVRLNRDGSYDSTFNDDGKLMLYFDDPQLKYYVNVATSIRTDHKGKILIAGSTARQDNVWDNSYWGPGITRLNDDGSLDTTFEANGKRLLTVIEENANKLGMFDIQPDLPDSKILLATSIDGNFGVFRLNYNGSMDSTFGDNGLAMPTHGFNYSMKADSNYIWMAGSDAGDYKIVKLYARNNQQVYFSLPDTVQYGDPPLKLGGMVSSGLPVSYTSSDPTVAGISHDTLSITGWGTVTITASQEGDGSFYAADPVSRNLVVKSNSTNLPVIDPGIEISVYPNPVSRILFLEGRQIFKSIVLTGVEGSLLFEEAYINDQHFKIDMSGFKPGCYIITIQFDGNHPAQVRKVLKY